MHAVALLLAIFLAATVSADDVTTTTTTTTTAAPNGGGGNAAQGSNNNVNHYNTGLNIPIRPRRAVIAPKPVDGGWGPWEKDIDCCMFGGDQRMKRQCNNPVPQNGGKKCEIKVQTGSTETIKYETVEFKWLSCDCKCHPKCDGKTAFCANDTGAPAHCRCIYGYVMRANPNDGIVSCDKMPATVAPVDKGPPKPDHSPLVKGWGTAADVIRYGLGMWVVLWMVLTILICLVNGEMSSLRLIHLQQELTIIGVYVIVAFVVMMPDKTGICKAASILLHYLFMATMTFFVCEATHIYSLVTFITPREGFCPVFVSVMVGYILPILPLGLSLALFWDDYGTDPVHCWCNLQADVAWAFIVPVLLLCFIGGIVGEAASLGKYKPLEGTDSAILHSAESSRDSILLVMLVTLLTYLFGLGAVDLQSKVLFIGFALLLLIMGPLVFVYHTKGHYKVCRQLYPVTPCLPFYKDTGEQNPNPAHAPDEPIEGGGGGAGGPEPTDTDPDQFYDWVTNKDTVGADDPEVLQAQSKNVLFNE